MYTSCMHRGYLGTKWPSHQLKYHLQPRCCGGEHQDTPSSPHLPLSTPGQPQLRCPTFFALLGCCMVPCPSPSTTGKRLLLLQDAGALAGRVMKPAPHPVLGSHSTGPLTGGPPTLLPAVLRLAPTLPSSFSASSASGPLRSETGSDRSPPGRRLRASLPCWKLAASTESLWLSWRQGEPRGRGVYPGPHSRPLRIKSLEHPLQPRRP